MDTKGISRTCAVICLGFALRSIVSLHPYSGHQNHPMYGDYEAQRHWQEITVNIPISDWYKNTSTNDLMYWGLDYPPLTAYHSWILGKIALKYNNKFVELQESRGYESDTHKNFMRSTVLFGDLMIYVPAIFLAVRAITNLKLLKRHLKNLEINHLLILLLYPGQILIDNGHFQYNNISLGLTLFAITFILAEKYLLSAISFTLALNYKQMELYHSLPFFVYLLRTSITSQKTCISNLISIAKVGVTVILIFALLWSPWIIYFDIFPVFRRIFPVARGIFEDKVSNFWCILNIFIKCRNIFSNESMVIMCAILTILATLPSCVHLFMRPTKLNFIYSLLNCSLSFFLFSYQVHEKSILLPVLPALLLFPIDSLAISCFLQITTFSMFPLLVKDGLTIPYICLSLIFYIACNAVEKEKSPISRKLKLIVHLSYVIGIGLALCHLYAPIPNKLPHIYPLLIAFYSFCHFILFKIYFNYQQICTK